MNKINIGKNWYVIQPDNKSLEEHSKHAFYHTEYEKECIICKAKFKYGRSNCNSCNLHILMVECPICDKLHKINFENLSGNQRSEIITKIQNNEEIYNCCTLECRQKLIYENQKKNKTGWCSEESIKKRNAAEHQIKRNQTAIKNGLKRKAVETQLKRGLHPTQNINLQSKKVLLMQLKKMGIEASLNDIEDQDSLIKYLKMKPLIVNNKNIEYTDAYIYNNRCGAIGLIGTNIKDGKRYALNAGKSKNLGAEIRKFWRIISQPEKQEADYDYGRWYKITHEYKDFEIVIICIDVSEEEALLNEAAWAYQNNANFKYEFKDGEKKQIDNTHGYWM